VPLPRRVAAWWAAPSCSPGSTRTSTSTRCSSSAPSPRPTTAVTSGRWWFGVGAALASLIWFGGLGFGARLLAPLLARPRSWQVLELLIAATMVLVAVKLALG